MKRIACVSIWHKSFSKDRFFDDSVDKCSANLRVPSIKLREYAEARNDVMHTIDMYKSLSNVDCFIFQDISKAYIMECLTPIKLAKYILKAKYRYDYLFKLRNRSADDKILIILEPPVVCPQSYNRKYHNQFKAVLTWNDDLVDNRKYFKLSIPQVPVNYRDNKSFSERAFLTMVCSNKHSQGLGELYSERRKVIDYFEKNDIPFDLYGYGWEKEAIKNYKGSLRDKLMTLSNYKFSICFENMTNIRGYITEKIFDCFFAGSIPIYWGADNIEDYIPSNCYIDFRRFSSLDELVAFLQSFSEQQYLEYIDNICTYLDSKAFADEFSVETYVKKIYHFVEQV